MKNKLKLVLMVMLSMMIVVGCGAKSPSDVVNSYFTEIKKGENAEVTNYLLDSMGEDSESKEEVKEDPKMDEAMKIYLSKINAKVLSEKIDGDNATVEVELSGLNLSTVIMQIFQEGLANAFSGKEMSEDDYSNSFLEKVKAGEVESRKGTVNLTKSDNEWKIKTDGSIMSLIFGQMEDIANLN